MGLNPNARDLLAGAGVLLAAVGVVFVVDPRLAGLGVGEAAVLVVGVLALLHGLWVVRERWDHEVEQAVTATPETPLSAPIPGTEFDRTLGYRVLVDEGRPYRQRVTSRLNDVTDDVALRYGTPDGGDDGFLDRGSLATDPISSVRGVLGGESNFQRRVREAVDGLAVRAGVADEPLGDVAAQPLPEDPAVDRDRPEPAVEAGDRREGLRRHAVRQTTRWRGVKAVALLSIGVGIVSKQPAVLLGGIAGFGYAGYAQSGSTPPVELSVERSLSDDSPRPGESVRVTLEVENAGDRTLPDLRIVDGVPAALPVTGGSPRQGVALRPGKAVRFSYTVTARRGEHGFDPLTIIARDATGAVEQEFTLHEATTLVCLPDMYPAAAAPLRAQGSGFAGQVRADVGGGGTEFHATREYRHGDPLNRIDWKRKARTGELATMEFREERLAKVLVVVDGREGAWRAPPDATHTSLDRSVYAAGRLFAALLDGGNQVGIAAAGSEGAWLSPGAGDEHLERARQLFTRHPALSSRPPEYQDIQGRYIDPMTHVRRRLPEDSQVFMFSPLVDDYAGEVAR
ncbi:MAG: DUF58 domain-containing protein, partial [Halobacteriaceae archaeon]